jgi:hypothetical protein
MANMQNEPNFPRAAQGWVPAGGTEKSLTGKRCKTNPISPRPGANVGGQMCKTNPICPRPEAADGENCAKRSQTWGDWGVWVKAVVARGVARPGSETCETNPICGPGARDCGLAIADCGLEDAGSGGRRRPNVQNEPNSRRGSVGRGLSDAGRGPIVQNEPNLAHRRKMSGEDAQPTKSRLCKTNPISATGGRSQAGLPRSGTVCRGNPDQVGGRPHEEPRRAERTQFRRQNPPEAVR